MTSKTSKTTLLNLYGSEQLRYKMIQPVRLEMNVSLDVSWPNLGILSKLTRKSRIPDKKLRFLIQQIMANELRHAWGPVLPSDRYLNSQIYRWIQIWGDRFSDYNCNTIFCHEFDWRKSKMYFSTSFWWNIYFLLAPDTWYISIIFLRQIINIF